HHRARRWRRRRAGDVVRRVSDDRAVDHRVEGEGELVPGAERILVLVLGVTLRPYRDVLGAGGGLRRARAVVGGGQPGQDRVAADQAHAVGGGGGGRGGADKAGDRGHRD